MSDIYGTESLFLPLPWLTALAASDLRLFLYTSRGIYGALRVLHLLGLGGFFGPSLILALRAVGLLPPAPGAGQTRAMNASFLLVMATGVLLFLRDPIGVGLHSMFLPKVLLLGIGLAIAIPMARAPRAPIALSQSAISPFPARRAGAVALCVVWSLVVVCSTWNHVERPVGIGAMLRATTSVPR